MRDLLGSGLVAEAAAHHMNGGGGRIRAQIALDAAARLGLDTTTALSCAAASELLHNASLVHDDVQDADKTRRNRPTVWQKFNVATAICVGDLMMSAAYASLAAHPDPARALKIMHDAISRTTQGQSEDLRARAGSLREYKSIAMAKSGPLLALPMRLALSAAGAPGDQTAKAIGARLAIAYQVLDDIKDREADLAIGSVNICLILEANGASSIEAACEARREAREALQEMRILAAQLPAGSGQAYCNLADQMDRALQELLDAA
ncbi:polyprenyl synthetase family protein [Loktanella sp. SALINAS62]|uniref:FPP/GGPP synthase family protein n=1 Tax=Loktanella sp. SALINAS62 TaxID=2706124 RepID=UPI001B8C5377|nr:polyprenyl synthetase family protein [Loktanella sp. SALINAS62]MBS1303389.1 polyprenyl synthetase family protein [Loktanella sp. SALINAS62]